MDHDKNFAELLKVTEGIANVLSLTVPDQAGRVFVAGVLFINFFKASQLNDGTDRETAIDQTLASIKHSIMTNAPTNHTVN